MSSFSVAMERRPTIRAHPEHDPTDTLPLVAREMKRRLRLRADREVTTAVAVMLDLEIGYKPAEIRERQALTRDEYNHAVRWVEDCAAEMRNE